MKAISILIPIFLSSFLLALVWSYNITKKDEFNFTKLYKRKFTFLAFTKRIKLAIQNFIMILVLTISSLYLIGDSYFSFNNFSVIEIILSIIVLVVADDLWFYGLHRLMHKNQFIYRKIHLVHHKAMPPIPLDYLFAHPIEPLFASFGLVVGALVLIPLFGAINIYGLAIYAFYRIIHELCVHSGFVIVPEKWLGIVGSSRHHFNHHKYLNGNYASAFTYLDKLFGTEIKE